MTNKQTTTALTAYTASHIESASKASVQAVCAMILWGAHNPGEWIETVSGKTPKAFKAFKVSIEATAGADRTRQVVTVAKKAFALLAGVAGNEKALRDDAAMRKDVADLCNRLVTSFAGLTVGQAIESDTGLFTMVTGASADSMAGIKAAYSAALDADTPAEAPAPAPESVDVTDADADVDESQATIAMDTKSGAKSAIDDAIALLASVVAHGHADQASAKAIKAMADFIVQAGKPSALLYAFDQLVADAADDIPRLEGMVASTSEALAESKVQTCGPIPAMVG